MAGTLKTSEKSKCTYCDPKSPSSASPVCRVSWTAHLSLGLLPPVPSKGHQHKLSKAKYKTKPVAYNTVRRQIRLRLFSQLISDKEYRISQSRFTKLETFFYCTR